MVNWDVVDKMKPEDKLDYLSSEQRMRYNVVCAAVSLLYVPDDSPHRKDVTSYIRNWVAAGHLSDEEVQDLEDFWISLSERRT